MESISSSFDYMIEGTEQLIDISERLLGTLSQMRTVDIERQLEHRQSIIDDLQIVWEKMEPVVSDPPSIEAEQEIKELSLHFKNRVARFTVVDQALQELLEQRVSATGRRLSHLHQMISLINKYVHVQDTTGLVARLFRGNSRNFDHRL